MKSLPLKTTLAALALSLGSAGYCVEPGDNEANWGKAADNHIYVQTLVNEAMAHNPDVVVIGIHANKQGTKDERMIATNLDRINKMDDDDDKAGAIEGKTVLAPNPKEPDKYEVLMPFLDASGNRIGAIGIVFKYKQGDSLVELLKKATKVRDGISKKIKNADAMFAPAK